MRKLSARWVPRLLTADHKRAAEVESEQCLGTLKRNSKKFLRHYMTVDETWIHYYTPETKNQSKMWTGPGESALKKAKMVPSAGKVMATIFWDLHGIILMDYLQKRKTITEEYYASLLDRFDAILKEKQPHLAKKVFFYHDNAPANTSAIRTAKLFDLRNETLPHPPDSLDLVPSDYFLFPNMKFWLGGKRFSSNEDITAATNEYFEGLIKITF